MGTSDNDSRFDRVDWSRVDSGSRTLTAERVTLLVGFCVLVALFFYDTYIAHVYLIGTYKVTYVDWLFFLGILLIVSYGGIPTLRDGRGFRRVLASLYAQPTYAVATTVLAALILVGLIGPFVFGTPRLRFEHRFHAPYGFTGEMGWTTECLGEITPGEGITRYCDGSLANPLGTNHRGHSLAHMLVTGSRVALYVVVFTLAFVVPLAAAVGVIAGLRGGLVDDLLMGYVDVQLCIPAIIVYFIGYVYWNPSLLLLLVTFGLLSWGGIARLVRSEVLQRREDGHVLVARSFGASERYIARRHIVPNITNTLVPAVFHLVALLVLVEAGVAFLGFHEIGFYSWGSTIAEGLDVNHHAIGFEMQPHEVWWIATFPTIALSLTLVSLKLVGDGVRDALDPRHGHHR